MKIAVGTDDHETIRKDHFGESRRYRVLEVLNAEVVGKEWRESAHIMLENGRARHGQSQRIIELLQDCSLFMGRSFGKRSLQMIKSRGIDCIITSIENIDRAVSSYLDGQDEGFHYYDKKSKAFSPCAERTFEKQT